MTMERPSHVQRSGRGRMLFCLTGWTLAAVLACFVLPRVYARLRIVVPSVREEMWRKTLDGRKAVFTKTIWKDHRPLHIFAGDSHVEMGDWYELFQGDYAVRNCGLARATIEDVTGLMAAVPDRNVDTVLLMCGINNLGRKDSVQSCLADYEKLLKTVRATFQPQKIFVMSIMPIRQSFGDQRARALNQEVSALNEGFKELCVQQKAIFINVNDAIKNAAGSLSDHLTEDGLHLNADGYKRMADVVREYLIPEARRVMPTGN